ncbi:MAG: hypothetical protein AB7F40_08895 [Victivallaceae bacterium]|nr:hypothetical protein [Victivallaceae bacterium]
MSKQVTRLILWVVIIVSAVGASLALHAHIDSSGENKVVPLGAFFEEQGFPFQLNNGQAVCVITGDQSAVCATGKFTGSFGFENSFFANPGTARHIRCQRDGKEMRVEVEYCKFGDLEFRNLSMYAELGDPVWRFTALATIPLGSESGRKLFGNARISDLEVMGEWTPKQLILTNEDKTFRYRVVIKDMPVPTEGETAASVAAAPSGGRDGGAAGVDSETAEAADNAVAVEEDDGIRREIEFSFTTKTE